jgi:hypothetical protein
MRTDKIATDRQIGIAMDFQAAKALVAEIHEAHNKVD